MTEYVKKSTLYALCGQRGITYLHVSDIDNMPAADVAPVVHAKWGEYEAFTLAPSMNGYPCGNCGMHFSASVIPILNFCPNCGAKMDVEQEE